MPETLFDQAIYDLLPIELRLDALGLDASEAPRPIGRPRVLTTPLERVNVFLRWWETANGLARQGPTTKHPGLEPVLKQIGRARDKGALPLLARLSRQADGLGRYHSTPYLPPAESKPAIDKIVAAEVGLSERLVRSVRTDRLLKPFEPQPLWAPRAWEQQIAQQSWASRRARALLTPEHYTKVACVLGERNGGIAILDNLEQLAPLLTGEQYARALEFQRRCYAGGLGHLVWGRFVDGDIREPWEDPRELCFPTVWRSYHVQGVGTLTRRLQNVALPKIAAQAPYNQAIIDHIGLRGLKFLRTVLYESYPIVDVGYCMGAKSPEDARQRVVGLLRQLLDAIPEFLSNGRSRGRLCQTEIIGE
jgi:hypothetical protein